jgi:hypothetical protein
MTQRSRWLLGSQFGKSEK